jgi:hypothetical protein
MTRDRGDPDPPPVARHASFRRQGGSTARAPSILLGQELPARQRRLGSEREQKQLLGRRRPGPACPADASRRMEAVPGTGQRRFLTVAPPARLGMQPAVNSALFGWAAVGVLFMTARLVVGPDRCPGRVDGWGKAASRISDSSHITHLSRWRSIEPIAPRSLSRQWPKET